MLARDEDTYTQIIQLRISNARLKYRLTQEQIAEKAGMPVRSYQGLEGLRESRQFNPTLLTLRRVAAALEIPLYELIQEPQPQELELLSAVLNNRVARRAGKS